VRRHVLDSLSVTPRYSFSLLTRKIGNKAYSIRQGTERIIFPFVSETPKQPELKSAEKKQKSVEKKENQRKKRTMDLEEDLKTGPFNDCLRELKLCRSRVIFTLPFHFNSYVSNTMFQSMPSFQTQY
jgi:hypothetical protein